jgi:polysaccharide deacetylase family protein (PEP-CTERM system associated)
MSLFNKSICKLKQHNHLTQLNKPINQSTDQQITNALTIDVEDYFMVSAFADVVRFDEWHKYESRIEKNTRKILDLLDEYKVQATFFVLGWVAERHPELIRDIHSRGHEIACHSYNHMLIYHLTRAQFREDVYTAKSILEDITGAAISGYRAPSYSITPKTLWALDILIEEGFLYDSSIFPIHHDLYGFPGANRFPHVIKRANGTIIEFPPSTYKLFGQNIPVAGGGYLRLFPLQITKSMIKKINTKEQQPVTVYFHPWEIDKDQPRLNGCLKSKLRHYMNLKSTFPKLKSFLKEFRFRPLGEFVDSSLTFDPPVSLQM